MHDESGVKERLEEGQASLESMMETLRPFLPKLDLSQPDPANDWQATDQRKSVPQTSNDTNFVRSF